MSISTVDAVSGLTQCGKVITVTFTFRDSYEAAVAFDEIADSLTENGKVSLKINGRFRRVVQETKPAPQARPWWRQPKVWVAFGLVALFLLTGRL